MYCINSVEIKFCYARNILMKSPKLLFGFEKHFQFLFRLCFPLNWMMPFGVVTLYISQFCLSKQKTNSYFMMPAVNYFGFCIMWEMKKFDFYFISTKRENVSTANQSKMECKRDLDMDAWSVAVLKVLILLFSLAFSFSSYFWHQRLS